MQKTPDEIKKELGNPIHVHYHISDIEPRLKPLDLHDLEFLHTDALAYIQQLESENAEKDARIQQLEAERDAAVADLKKAENEKGECFGCKWYNGKNCTNKDYKLICSSYDDKWEWRGVQKEYSDD